MAPTTNNFRFQFKSSKTPGEIFKLLQNIPQWWSGLYNETISGNSENLHDEFSFSAGGGAHFSRQKLVELIPDNKITWLVTESNLSFLKNHQEWNDTKISFELSKEKNATNIVFTHEGLIPQIECYDSCSSAWTSYLQNLKSKLN